MTIRKASNKRKEGNRRREIKSEILKCILKECFWDYNFSEEDIVEIAVTGDFNEKMFLFQKILANSKNVFKSLRVFSMEDLKKLLENYRVPNFKHDYLQRRKDIVEFVYFGKEVDIPDLRWREK